MIANETSEGIDVAGSFTDRHHFKVLDFGFQLETGVEQAAGTVLDVLRRFEVAADRDRPDLRIVDDHQAWAPYALYLRDEPLCEHTDLGEVLDYLFWYVNRRAIEATENYLLVHAAAASLNGKGVLLPARMDSGKTTLVAGLTRAGFDYLSDEAALLDPVTAYLHPYPKALWMERKALDAVGGMLSWAGPRMGERYQVPPEDLRKGSVGSPVPVSLVIAPRYVRGVRSRVEEIGRGEAIVLLKSNAFNFSSFGGDGLDLFKRVTAGARCFRMTVGNLNDAVGLIGGLITGEADKAGSTRS
ncbi:MAG: hypothetical protein ACRDJ2_16275 [Actinomycetota bacterium]